MAQYAIFIEPEGDLTELILSWKRKVEAVLPGQTYCGDPPHSTLLCADFKDSAEWTDRLAEAAGRCRRFTAEADGTLAFYDDSMAGGGHTIALRVVPSPELSALQVAVAEALAPFLDPKPEESGGLRSREPYRTSWLKYGFPFAGEHWIPHMTIASLRVERKHALIGEFLSLRPRYGIAVDRIGVWRVEGSVHSKVAALELGRGAGGDSRPWRRRE